MHSAQELGSRLHSHPLDSYYPAVTTHRTLQIVLTKYSANDRLCRSIPDTHQTLDPSPHGTWADGCTGQEMDPSSSTMMMMMMLSWSGGRMPCLPASFSFLPTQEEDADTQREKSKHDTSQNWRLQIWSGRGKRATDH